MEMDIPLPEELEWLESCANSNYGGHEETLDEAEELLELCRTVPDGDGPEIHSQKRQLERIVGYDGIPGEEQAPKKIKRSGPDGTHNAALEDDASETGIPRPDELEWLESLDGFQEEAEFDDVEADELLELCKANGEAGQGMQKPHQEKGGRNREDPTEKPTGKTSKDPAFDENNDYSSYAEADEDWLLRYIPDKDCHTQETTEMGNSEPESVKEKTISRFASEIDGDFFSVTGSNGDRVYAKLKSQMPVAEGKVSRTGSSGKGLLGEPINVLMDRVEEGAIQTALQQSSVSSPTISESTMAIVNEQLWVDKYAPKFFPELLSDEQTNREVLLWLKQWDPCVYGSRIRATTEDVLSSLRRHSTLMQHHKSSDNKFFNKNSSIFNNMKFNQSTDMENGGKGSREGIESHSKNEKLKSTPEQKVLLLCGPPGLGKTTLAHVAAKHCGYRVVEVNASDDRSASSIESKILDVVQMNSVMADSKPKCLVIDEIDGALGDGKGAIDVILKMVSSDRKANSKDDQMDEKSGKKQSRKGHKSTSLSRPVICICNDLYAPALRPLRQVAKVHLFAQPTINRVVNRLKYICNKEGFKASSIALSALADHTECDIRSCLNTLQFLNKKKEYLNILEIGSQVVGRKDMSKSAFDVWKEVLQKRKDKHDKFNKSNNASRDFERLYSLLSDRGEYELTMDGIYENFLHLSYHDPSFQKTVCCLDALGISDSWHRFVARTHHMHLNGYQPFIAIYIKNLIAQINKPHIEWPKSLQRCRMTLIEKKDQLKCWYNKISPHISRHLSIESFAEELVSPLLNIISPPSLRPVALHLLSEREKEDLHQLVDTMSSYSISYKSSNPQPASETYKYGSASEVEILSLHPPLDSFVNFKDYQSEIHRLSSALKKLLVHEVEMYKIKSEGNSRLSNINGDSIKEIQNTSIKDGSAKSMSYSMNKGRDPTERNLRPFKTNSSPTLNGNSASAVKLKASEITKSPSNPSNFFDRFKKRSKIAQNTGAFHTSATMERDQRPFLFRYNEGYTNAVKRPVKMRELLL